MFTYLDYNVNRTYLDVINTLDRLDANSYWIQREAENGVANENYVVFKLVFNRSKKRK